MAGTTESSAKVDGKQRARPGAVLRKIAPHQPGAIRLAERYGELLDTERNGTQRPNSGS